MTWRRFLLVSLVGAVVGIGGALLRDGRLISRGEDGHPATRGTLAAAADTSRVPQTTDDASSGAQSRAARGTPGSPGAPLREVRYRSFSTAAAIDPPMTALAERLASVTRDTLGTGGEVRLVRLPGVPPVPPAFRGDVLAAVAAGEAAGGLDAAYVSGAELSPAWGFLVNSGWPLGPTFDEFLGFLYGRVVDRRQTGAELVQELLDQRGRGVVALPVAGSSEQLSGYFPEPLGDVPGRAGIGLGGLCQRPWRLRYLPPAQDVLELACDELVRSGRIPRRALSFVQAVPGGGSLAQALQSGQLSGLELATPLDDLSQLFSPSADPGSAGARFVHGPGWHQPFLVTWLVVRRATWDQLGSARQALVRVVAQASLAASYGESMRQQGWALRSLLAAGQGDPRRAMVLSRWPAADLARLRAATERFLDARASDPRLSRADREDYGRVLGALRAYVQEQALYWSVRRAEVGPR